MDGQRLFSIGYIASLLGHAPSSVAKALDASGVSVALYLNDIPYYNFPAIQAARLFFDRSKHHGQD
jgi:hypothetical protein